MADQDDLYYLQPGFDLNTLTVPRLRQILVAHDIGYPSSSKKADLIDVVTTELLPQARKLLRERDRMRRTSRGIIDVPSSQESSTYDEDDDERESMPPPPAPKTPRSRKSRTQLNQDAVEPTPRTARRSKTPTNRRSTKAPRYSDTETTETEQERIPASNRKTRKSTPGSVPVAQTTSVRVQDASNRRSALETEDSPFTQENPFQSGSSPPAEPKHAPSSSRTRKSLGTSSTRKSTSRRRASPIEVKRESVEFPVSRLSVSADGIETTEEFTEDAQEELKDDMAHDRSLVKSRKKDMKKLQRKPKSTAAKAAPWTLLVTALSALAAWYRQEKVAIGYCGIGQSSWSVAHIDGIPEFVHEVLQPQCEPCPQHAICYPNMKAECEYDFVLRQHPLSFGGLIPLPPVCEPDSEKERRIKHVADKAVEVLRDERAAYECGGKSSLISSSSEESTTSSSTVVSPVKNAWVPVEVLKETVSRRKRKGMSEDEFEDLWKGAYEEMLSREEMDISRDKSTRINTILVTSKSDAKFPLTCYLRRNAVRTLVRYRVSLFLLASIISGIAYGYQRLLQFQSAKKQTPQLVAMVLDRLATQAALKEDGRTPDPFLAVSQIRDDVLRNVFSRTERERVWDRVKKVVEANSNIRAGTRMFEKTGETARAWEWIGDVNFAPGLKGRRSGGLIGSSPAAPSQEVTPQTNGRPSAMEIRKWDEGRVIY